MKILVIDGQGGHIGHNIVEQLIASPNVCDVIAVGTNSAATAAMMKAGAQQGATGENPVIVASRQVDLIIGPMGIIAANALMGEITPAMALAVSESPAKKILIPMNRCGISVAGVKDLTMKEYTRAAVTMALDFCKEV
ncbi:MAG: DUF3842 family protein [Eubacteriaceae bacterium]|nr:DUF3842 family protein [Eubacteriaceae bacterium]